MRIWLDDQTEFDAKNRKIPEGFDLQWFSSDEAIRGMTELGCPDFIDFDHDLGGDDNAMKIVNWMINRDIDRRMDFDPDDPFIPWNFDFNVHSANPIGADNIRLKLGQYLEQRNYNANRGG